MACRLAKPPAYCLHRPSGRAVVYLERRPVYLGLYGSPESHEAHSRTIAQWRLQDSTSAAVVGRLGPNAVVDELTISELLIRYLTFARDCYVDQDGASTKEFTNMRCAAKPLRHLLGPTLVRDFGPLALKTVRAHLVEGQSLCRQLINRKWAVSEEIAPRGSY